MTEPKVIPADYVDDREVRNLEAGEPIDLRNPDSGPGWLLVGKLAPPEQRITVASRDALLARLDASLSRSVSVIISPPGFGKTTLLTQWWRTLETRPDIYACWLTLDEIDSEVSRFVAGVILSVARAGVDVGALEVSARQLSIDPNVRPIALALLEAIRRSGRRTVLILDDFHRARSPAVDEVVETLIEHSHGELHLVVSGRFRPTFHVSALLARGLVTLLDAGDLVLSLDQASQVLGTDVSPADLAVLHARTEGWAVALQLARLWLDRGRHRPEALKDFSGRTTEMTDYLAEQIVADLPEELREFLLETAILERFDAALADAVRKRSDSEELLERLQHFDALLIPLDDAREWFRYHRLFADFLCQRLKRSSAHRPVLLHRRAARALAAVGDLPEAVQHAIEADDTALAVGLTQQARGWELILWKGIGYVRSLLKCFNELTIRSEPALQLTQAYLDIKLGRLEAARELLALSETTLDTAEPRIRRDFIILKALWNVYIDDVADSGFSTSLETQSAGLEPSDHLGRGTLICALAVAALGRGAPDRAEAESRRAIQEMRAAGSILGVNYAFLHLAHSQLLSGRLREAETLFREALVVAEDNFGADSGLKALCSSFVGYCLYLKGDNEASNRLVESLVDTTDGWVDVFATAYEVRARQAFARGGLGEAIAVIAQATRVAQDRKLHRLGLVAAAWRVELLTLAGRHQDAKREASAAGVFAAADSRGFPDFLWRVRLAATIAVGRLWAASGATAQALQLVDTARAEFRLAQLVLPACRLDALSIAILKQRGANEEALARLQVLLEFVVAEGASGILLEQGRALEGLLHSALRRNRELVLSGAQRDLIANVLALLNAAYPGDHDGFSSRELEVLRELCNGRSNKAIGQFLDMSENTVKFHLKRIFKKLGAESRAGAMTAALQKNLVIPDDGARKR
ncbi:MAG TPA: LuxR C-terminal-related transcriptional regulator [Steroidobacteraceae bacterium]